MPVEVATEQANGSAALGVAVLSLVGTLAVALYTGLANRKLQEREAAAAAELARTTRAHEERLRQVEHQQHITLLEREAAERERQERSTRASVARLYREPLLIAAIELYGRLRNIASQRFLQSFLVNGLPHERRYAVDHTLYLVAQYFCWVEIIRKEVQFLEPDDEAAERQLIVRFQAVNDAFSSDDLAKVALHRLKSFPDAWQALVESTGRGKALESTPTFRLFRGEQRALGELMVVSSGAASPNTPRWGSMSYADFCSRMKVEDFSFWFDHLREDLAALSDDVTGRGARLLVIQAALVDLMNELDPESKRSPHHDRDVTPLVQ